jgi:hypothetical protein
MQQAVSPRVLMAENCRWPGCFLLMAVSTQCKRPGRGDQPEDACTALQCTGASARYGVASKQHLQLQQRRQHGQQAARQRGALTKAQRLDGKLQREAQVLRRLHLHSSVASFTD